MTSELDLVVDRLRETFDSGRTADLDWRRRQLDGVIALVRENERELCGALGDDLGKPAFDTWLTELNLVKEEALHAKKHLGSWSRRTSYRVPAITKPSKAWTQPQPLGVALIIAPWNYPVQLLLAPAIGALAAGNAMVLKPSELAPATAESLADLIPRYLDTDAVAVVEGGVTETTELLDRPWDHILFTGSTTVGRVVMSAAAKHLTPVTLELGGKSPTIVAADANLPVAARRIAWAKLLNAGQTCIAPDYVLVERPVADEFCGLVTAALADLHAAASPTSIVNDDHLGRLERLLEGHNGDELLPRSVDAVSRVFAPMVIRSPASGSAVMTDEIFGPILPVVEVDDIDEAVAFVRARPRPLALYLFTSSEDTEADVLARTHAGSVCINHLVYQVTVNALPFGGIGASGMGAYHGKAGFDTFSHHKPVLKRPTSPDPRFVYPPYSRTVQRLLKSVTRW